MRSSQPPLIATLTLALSLGACETMPMTRGSSDHSADRFDARAVAWSNKSGRNTIIGTASLTAVSGETKTCAGLEVRLVPSAPYTRTRIAALYGTTDEGFVTAVEARRVQGRTDAAVDPAYKNSHKVTKCDAGGRFAFADLASGTYYVLAPVVWRTRTVAGTDGGFLMQRVRVANGETKTIHMTPPSRISALSLR